jgi:pimeloyl-ACP methyl ester carboxylesterase/DNA-binding CsgD family transcriptional regulator
MYVAGWPVHLQMEWELPFVRDFLRELAGGCTLVRYDMRGSGLSDRDVPPPSFGDLVDDLSELIDHLGLARLSLLALGDLAAPLAIAYTARRPERVERLLIHAGYSRGAELGDPAERQLMADYIRNFGFPIFKFVDQPGIEIEQQRAMYHLHESAASHALQAAIFEMMSSVDVTDAAATVRVPTLVMHATEDQVVPAALGRQLAATIPGAEFTLFTGSSAAPWAHQSMLIPEIHRFLGKKAMSEALPGGVSPREADVLRLIAAGKSNRQIAEALTISVHTADRHVRNILIKIGAANRAEAASFAVRHGLAE